MKQEMQIILEVSTQAGQFYEDAIQLGDHAAYAVKKKHRAQLTGLETVAESALKVSDILDYVKRQTARLPYWRQAFSHEQSSTKEEASWHTIYTGDAADKEFGERLKHYVEHVLAAKREVLCRTKLDMSNKSDEERMRVYQRVYLLLIRQFIRQLVIQYEYRLSFDKERKGV